MHVACQIRKAHESGIARTNREKVPRRWSDSLHSRPGGWSDSPQGVERIAPRGSPGPLLDPVRYLDDHVRTFIEKDIAATAGIAKLREFRTFLGLLAARSGQLLNASEIGQQAGVKESTVQEWISLLAQNGVVAFVQPYASNLNKRLVTTPKVFFVDVGVVTRLQGWRSLEPLLVSPQMGPLFETAVFAELVRCRDHRLLGIEIFLWRTRDGEELDFLVRLETCHRGPLWIPIEAKLGGHAALGAAIPPGPDFSNSGAAVAGDWRPAVEGIIRLYSWSSPYGPVALSSTQRS